MNEDDNFFCCDECGGKIIKTSSHRVCSECGLVFEQIFDDREPVTVTESGNAIEQFKHHGPLITHSTPAFSTTNKHRVPLKMMSTNIGRVINKYSYYNQKNIKNITIFSYIKRICSNLKMNYLYEHCCYLFKKIDKLGNIGSLEYAACAIIYLQCHLYNIPIYYHDFVKIGYDKKKIRGYVKKWSSRLKISISPILIENQLWKIIDFYISDVDIRLKIRLHKNILKIIKKYNPNLNKTFLSHAIIYLLFKKFKYIKISLKQIEKDFSISEMSLVIYLKIIKNNKFINN